MSTQTFTNVTYRTLSNEIINDIKFPLQSIYYGNPEDEKWGLYTTTYLFTTNPTRVGLNRNSNPISTVARRPTKLKFGMIFQKSDTSRVNTYLQLIYQCRQSASNPTADTSYHVYGRYYKWGLGMDFGLIDHFCTRLVSTSNYRAIANVHNS
jgi:hypothetical protein